MTVRRIVAVLGLVAMCVASTARAGTLYLVSERAAPNGAIGKYDSTTGAAINASFLTGLSQPHSLAFTPDLSHFYVTNFTTSVRKYDYSGALVSGSYFPGIVQGSGITTDPATGAVFVVNNGGSPQWLNKFNADGTVVSNNFANVSTSPDGVMIDGTAALVVRWASSAVGKYLATGTGGPSATINASYITNSGVGTWRPFNIAKDSVGNYYVTGNDRVSKFAANGSLISQNFISFTGAYGLAIDENDNIFVGAQSGSTVGKYSSSGAVINASFITGVPNITSIVIEPVAVPEPSTLALAGGASVGLWFVLRRRRA
jgi:DNA-binding beta-propeller fold protein YncE